MGTLRVTISLLERSRLVERSLVTTATVNEIAERLRGAAADQRQTHEAFASLYAGMVELRHEPPLESDRSIPGELLVEIGRRETSAASRALSDSAERQSEITVEDESIRVRGRIRGTMADGTPVDVRTNTLFGVRGGVIISLTSDMDAGSMKTWGEVLRAGGFEMPSDLHGRDARARRD